MAKRSIGPSRYTRPIGAMFCRKPRRKVHEGTLPRTIERSSCSGSRRALRWRHIDLDGAQISVTESAEQTKAGVRYKPPKSGKGRTVALPASVVGELRSQRARQAEALLKVGIRVPEDTFVVAQAMAARSTRSLTHALELFLAKHKLPHVPMLDLRHTHATEMLKAKVHPKVVQERLGHSTIAITLDTYSHILEGMQEDAAEIVDADLQAALNRRRNKDWVAKG